MKQYKKFLLLLLVLIIVLIGTGTALASDQLSQIFVPKEDVDAYVNQQIKINNKDVAYTQHDDDNKEQSFYDSLYSSATTEQRKLLDRIIEDKSIGLPGEWKREALIVVGQLSAETPRITLHDAERLWGKHAKSQNPSSDLVAEFNQIAGAPDWEGGSGIHRSIYFLDDERTEAIYVIFGNVLYVAANETGEQTIKQIGQQTLSVSPTPSSQAADQANKNAYGAQAPKSTPAPVPFED